jgi:hypothetical protein
MLTDGKFWIGLVAGMVLYFVYTSYLRGKMKG